MTESSVNFGREPGPLARTLSPRALVMGGLIAVALMSATYAPPSTAIGHAVARKALVDSSRREAIPANESMKIEPANPLAAGGPDKSTPRI